MNKRILVLIFLLVATVAFRAIDIYYLFFTPYITLAWNQGYTITYDGDRLVVLTVTDRDLGGTLTPARKSGLKKLDRIVAIRDTRGDSTTMHHPDDFFQVMKKIHFGESYTLTVKRGLPPEPVRTLQVTIPPVSQNQIDVRSNVLELFAGIIFPFFIILTAAFIGLMKPRDNNAFTASLLFFCFSTYFGSTIIYNFSIGFFAPIAREFSLLYIFTLSAFIPYLTMRFFLRFPSPSVIERKLPWLHKVVLSGSIFLWLWQCVFMNAIFFRFQGFWDSVNPVLFLTVTLFLALFTFAALGIGLLSLILNIFMARHRGDRQRLVILLVGTLGGILPLFIIYMYYIFASQLPSVWPMLILLFSLFLFPLTFAYVVIRHRVLGIRLILHRGLQYAMVSKGFLLTEGVVVVGIYYYVVGPVIRDLSEDLARSAAMLGLGISIILSVYGLQKLNQLILPRIDRHFFRDSYDARKILSELTQAVRRLSTHTDKILDVVTKQISDALYPEHVAVFLRNAVIVDSSPIASDTKIAAIRFVDQPTRVYRCFRYRLRRPPQEGDPPDLRFDQAELPADSPVIRHLETVSREEPQPQDVYLADSRSWVHSLADSVGEVSAIPKTHDFLAGLRIRLIVPLVVGENLLGFITLGDKLSEEPYTGEDKELLMTVAQQVAIALDYGQMFLKVAEQDRMHREMEIAREVQSRLFPQTRPEMASLDYAARCQTARDVGGDYYDFILLEPGLLGIALGDISGKGISAALLMASLHAALHSHAHVRPRHLDRLFTNLNRFLFASTESNRFATFFYGVFQDRERSFTYINAGHNPPMLLRSGGVPPPDDANGHPASTGGAVRSSRLERLESGGIPLGMFADSEYRMVKIELHPGDILLLFTDGISDAQNPAGEQYGEERLERLLIELADKSAPAILQSIVEDVTAFTGSAEQFDDMTLVVTRAR